MTRFRALIAVATAAAAIAALVGASATRAVPPPMTVYVWIGLKNSDDVGTSFDLKAVLTPEYGSATSGETDDVWGGSSGFNNAHRVPIVLSNYVGATGASLTVYVRVSCLSRHLSGTARLWYDWNDADSSRLEDAGLGTQFLRTGFALNPSPGADPKNTIDKFAKKSGCPEQPPSNWIPFGTWVLPD